MKYEDLDCKQKEVIKVVLEKDCIILVIGGAGTGKTTNALWCARGLFEQFTDYPNPRVLFLTFSRAAISQIMRRCPGVIAENESNVEIMTFHALAYRLIRSFGSSALLRWTMAIMVSIRGFMANCLTFGFLPIASTRSSVRFSASSGYLARYHFRAKSLI